MAKDIRVCFLLPRDLEAAVRRIMRADPSLRSRTAALLRVIAVGVRTLDTSRTQTR